MQGNDSKFFERHASLLTALLDERFDGEASRQGLAGFLGALPEDDHWLLIAPLAPGLLPFAQMRVRASELLTTAAARTTASCWWKTNAACTNCPSPRRNPCQAPSPCWARA